MIINDICGHIATQLSQLSYHSGSQLYFVCILLSLTFLIKLVALNIWCRIGLI